MRHTVTALSLLALLGPGCAMDFRPASLVPRARLVGMRAVVPGAPERASLLPGETVDLVPIVVAPEGASPITTAWQACPLAPSRTGVPGCGGAPIASGTAPLGEAATMTVTVPPDAFSRGLFALLFVVASCDGGATPELPPGGSTTSLSTCSGGSADARAELSLFTVFVSPTPALANRHPDLTDETVTLTDPDGVERPWDLPDPAVTGACAALPDEPRLPHVTLPVAMEGVELDEALLTWTFGITSSPDDREPYQEVLPGSEPPRDTREVIQISHYTTGGTFARQFSAIEGLEDTTIPSTIDWQLPDAADVPAEGLLVRFWWVARDLRGGMAVTDRALCVVPAAVP